MNVIKRLALKAIFTKEQRVVIWNALQYSFYRYDKSGNTKRAIRVGKVIDSVDSVFHDNRKKYSEREVANIVKGTIDDTIKAVCEVLNECKAEKKDGGCVEVHLMPGAVLDREKCEKCEHKDECQVRHLVFDEEQETETTSDKENTETEKTAEQGTETADKDIAEEVSEEKE